MTVEKETAEIKRLEDLPTENMTEREKLLHEQAIRDAYWRRRMAQRTPEEVERGVVAPGG